MIIFVCYVCCSNAFTHFCGAKVQKKIDICKRSGVFLQKIEFILLFYARRWLWMLAYGRHLGA